MHSLVPRGTPTPLRPLPNRLVTDCMGHTYAKTLLVVSLDSDLAGPPVFLAAKSGSPNSNPTLGVWPEVAQGDDGSSLGLPWKLRGTQAAAAGQSDILIHPLIMISVPRRQVPCELHRKLVLRKGSTERTEENESRSNKFGKSY